MKRGSSVDSNCDFFDPIYIPDAYYPETVLLVREAGGVLIVGDMLFEGRKDVGIVDEDLGIIRPGVYRRSQKGAALAL